MCIELILSCYNPPYACFSKAAILERKAPLWHGGLRLAQSLPRPKEQRRPSLPPSSSPGHSLPFLTPDRSEALGRKTSEGTGSPMGETAPDRGIPTLRLQEAPSR